MDAVTWIHIRFLFRQAIATHTFYKWKTYDRGQLLNPVKTEVATEEPMKKIVPKEVLEYQKKNSGKKRVKVRDGSTGY